MEDKQEILSANHLSANLLEEVSKLKDNLKELTINSIFTIINDFLHKEVSEPKPLDEFLTLYGSAWDPIITNAVKLEKLVYVSGIFTITVVNEKQFNCTAELYFKNTNNKWVLKKATSENFELDKTLLPASIQELKLAKIIKHEINAP